MPRGPMGHGGHATEKAKDFKGTLKKLFAYLKPYYVKFIFIIIFATGSTALIFGPKILAKATDKLSEGIISKISNTGGIDFGAIAEILIFLGCIYLLSALLNYIQGFLTSGISQRVAYDFRKAISEMDRLPLSYFDKHSSGDTLSRVTNDVDLIAQSLNQSMTQIVTSVVTVIGILIMMLTISIPMTLMALWVLPVSMALMGIIMKRTQKYFFKQQESLGNVNGHIEEMYGAHQVVKAFNGEEESVEKFVVYNDDLYESAWKISILFWFITAINNFCWKHWLCWCVFIRGLLGNRRIYFNWRYSGIYSICKTI